MIQGSDLRLREMIPGCCCGPYSKSAQRRVELLYELGFIMPFTRYSRYLVFDCLTIKAQQSYLKQSTKVSDDDLYCFMDL